MTSILLHFQLFPDSLIHGETLKEHTILHLGFSIDPAIRFFRRSERERHKVPLDLSNIQKQKTNRRELSSIIIYSVKKGI